MGKQIRLDKYLIEMGLGSRSQLKEVAKKGRIHVNGQPEKRTERKIDPDLDSVHYDGVAIAYRAWQYYMLNKPQGVVSATADNLHQTVIDLLDGDIRKDLFPVGRLDIDTEGLLLITNDGDLAHRLLSPKKHVDKQYYAIVTGTLPKNCIEIIADGMTLLDDTVVKPAKLEILAQKSEGTEVILTIREGKFHQVKRMFEALDCQVTYLKRLSMGSLILDDSLKTGEYRELTKDELSQLLETNYKENQKRE